MEIGWYIWSPKNSILSALVLISLLGCNKSKETDHVPPNKISSQKLSNVLLVCRAGNGFFSNYFKKYASKEQRYSHIGIISIEKDTAYVYHSEASELTGVGRVKRESLNAFLEDVEVFDFFEFDYSDSIKYEILKTVKNYERIKTPFDLDFNSFNDNELYCTELIATSVNKSLDSLVIQPSLLLNGKKLYALDDIYLNKKVKKVDLQQ